MQDSKRIEKSRKLAFLLRHDQTYPFEEGGWRDVNDVLETLQITLEELQEIVDKDSNRRFLLTEDKSIIRATYGHGSWMPKTDNTAAVSFPATLYHGTSFSSVQPIMEQGIQRRSRTHVHLSANKTTALAVGARHKKTSPKPVILCINTHSMADKKYNLYLSDGGVWLADYVPNDSISNQILIGETVAYFETDEQAMAILDKCNNPLIRQIIKERFEAEKGAMICSVNHCDDVSEVIDKITFEKDQKSKAITAFSLIPSDADEHVYEEATRNLILFINELRESILPDCILELMPVIWIEATERSFFYLNLLMWYRHKTRNVIRPIDWFDIQRIWEKSSKLCFLPPIEATSLEGLSPLLANQLPENREAQCGHAIMWLDLPSDRNDYMCDIQKIIWLLQDRGYHTLFGMSHTPGLTYHITLCILDEAK